MHLFSVKNAWRRLWKNKTLGFINITGLAIGMAAAFLVLLWVQNEFSFDDFQPDADREYLVTWMDKNKEVFSDGSPLPLSLAAAQNIPGIDRISCYYPHGSDIPLIRIDNQSYSEKNVVYTDTNWFHLFHYDFLAGNGQDFGLKNGLILTSILAKRFFGRIPAVGRTVRVDSTDYTVLGVVADNPTNSSFQFDLFLPLRSRFPAPALAKALGNWRVFTAKTFIRLKPGTDADRCAKQLDEFMRSNNNTKDATANMVSLKDMHFGVGLPSSDIVYGNRKIAVIFGCLGVLLLVIGCINYVNMATATASTRVKEISMKKIMGATRARLWLQFMGEALLTGFIALLLTIFVIWLTIPVFGRLAERNFTLSFANHGVLTVLFGTWVLSILLTGIYPSILLSANNPLGLLQSNHSPHSSSSWVRKALVVVQFTAAITLIIGTISNFAQLKYIQNRNEGYDRAQIFSIDLPSAAWFKRNTPDNKDILLNAFKTELLRQPAIQHATYVSGSMLDMIVSMAGIADWDGRDKNFNPMIYPVSIDPDFRQMFQLQLVSGKWFSPDDYQDKHNYILNETAAFSFGLHQPWVGQRFILLGDTGRVIGVVKDFHFRSFHEKIAPLVLVNDAPWKSMLFVKVAPDGIANAIRGAGQTFHRFFPDQPFGYVFLDEDFDRLYRSDIRTSELVGGFAGIAILLSCLGLLGLATFTAQQREKEIATRKILGASVGQIVGKLSGEFFTLVVVALLIACPIGWWATRKWLEGFAYRTEISWWMFVLAGCLAIAIAFLTVAIQALKAAIASPVKSLRNQ
jgi:putative ABC transport system permease protein